jgi:hypothetical protein
MASSFLRYFLILAAMLLIVTDSISVCWGDDAPRENPLAEPEGSEESEESEEDEREDLIVRCVSSVLLYLCCAVLISDDSTFSDVAALVGLQSERGPYIAVLAEFELRL